MPELPTRKEKKLFCSFKVGCPCCGPLPQPSSDEKPLVFPLIPKDDQYGRSLSVSAAESDGDRSLPYVDTHVHLEMVLQKLYWYEVAPSTCALSWSHLKDNEKRCWKVLGLSPCFWDGMCNRKGNKSWKRLWREISTDEQIAAKALGWTPESWDGKDWPLPKHKLWCDLEESVQKNLLVLGESELSWDELFCRHVPVGYIDGGDMRNWDDLFPTEQEAAKELGFKPETWNMEVMSDIHSYVRDFCGSGFEACIAQGCDSESLDTSVQLALAHPQVFVALGLHPKLAWLWETENMEERLLKAFDVCGKKAIAWGEFGLDFSNPNWWDDQEYIDTQKKIFILQLKYAVERNLPLVLHIREAAEDALSLLQKWCPKQWKAHVHGYHGPSEFVEAILATFPNFYFGLCGTVSMGLDGDGARMAKLVPIEKMLLETDAPYILPRGTAFNHCGQIPLIARLVAEIRGCSAAEVLEKSRSNTRYIYGI